MSEVTAQMIKVALKAIDDLRKARIEEQKWEPANGVQDPTEAEEMHAALEAALALTRKDTPDA